MYRRNYSSICDVVSFGSWDGGVWDNLYCVCCLFDEEEFFGEGCLPDMCVWDFEYLFDCS